MIIFITGISGAGKNTALKILEDNGFYCIDNTPPNLVPKILEIAENSKISNLAFVIDPRAIFTIKKEHSLEEIQKNVQNLIEEIIDLSQKYAIKILFLDCNEETLLKRYNSTRRIHPLDFENTVNGIRLEKKLLEPLKEKSHYIIDTS
ncbi:MAG: RNase adapter RapZ, partial [bacterium]